MGKQTGRRPRAESERAKHGEVAALQCGAPADHVRGDGDDDEVVAG